MTTLPKVAKMYPHAQQNARTYKLGNTDVIVADDGQILRVIQNHVGHAIGSAITRNPLSKRATFNVVFSSCGKFFYVDHPYSTTWLSVETYDDPTHVTQLSNTAAVVSYGKNPRHRYFRAGFDFAFAASMVGDKNGTIQVRKADDPLTHDGLMPIESVFKEREELFNRAIEHTGYTYESLLEKLGDWVPIPDIETVQI